MAVDVEGVVAAAEEEMLLLARGMDRPEEGDRLPESTLLVLPAGGGKGFLSEYRALVHASWDVQERMGALGLVGRLQQVLFHPHAVPSLYGEVGGDPEAEAAAYASRSPHPTLHFLREADIMRAVTSGYQQPELIPQRNAAKLQGIGEKRLRAMWASLVHTGDAARTA